MTTTANDNSKAHEVTFLSGGRQGESYTAKCSCGKAFKATHNYKLRSSITRHINAESRNADMP